MSQTFLGIWGNFDKDYSHGAFVSVNEWARVFWEQDVASHIRDLMPDHCISKGLFQAVTLASNQLLYIVIA